MPRAWLMEGKSHEPLNPRFRKGRCAMSPDSTEFDRIWSAALELVRAQGYALTDAVESAVRAYRALMAEEVSREEQKPPQRSSCKPPRSSVSRQTKTPSTSLPASVRSKR